MKGSKSKIVYDAIIFGFSCAGRLIGQRYRLLGKEHLKNVPFPVIFTVTHDSYFEIPALSRVYRALKPKPIFSVMAKKDFLSGEYLSTNFRVKSGALRAVLKLVDRLQLPLMLFRIMNVASVHRPFIEKTLQKKDELKQEISAQIDHFRDSLSQGMSTLIFPEGTTWGYGGLKRIRSACYQLVDTIHGQYGKKVYILPINVKVDRLVRGAKDIFVNVGVPQFVIKSKDEFNEYLFGALQRLHTITFSQIGAYYLKKICLVSGQTRQDVILTKDVLTAHIERVVRNVHAMVQNQKLPAFDGKLVDRKYLAGKVNGFIKYCTRNNYFVEISRNRREKAYRLNGEKILASYPVKQYRKLNPVGFHANELTSLGEELIDPLFDIPGVITMDSVPPAPGGGTISLSP
ncbi:MAG: 1-acyl-sn-glycerol-3-phosphate acyltransferase [Deltaproteobacteria bacterium]|nr:1-acyl-sn-glycerol-3-phosphate acyltransferase [Deltaproteobacteria bacterium]